SARPLNSSPLMTNTPWYVVSDESLPGINEPVSCQLNASPLTRPSTVPNRRPSAAWASPLTFCPFCWSTNIIVRSPRVGLRGQRTGPSHAPVTSTSVRVSVVQSPRAHPRLKRVSTIRKCLVHLMPISPVLDHCAFFSLMVSVATRRRRREHGQPCPSTRPLISSLIIGVSPSYDLLDVYPI